jgi:xanthine dehydrogenase accessory factor
MTISSSVGIGGGTVEPLGPPSHELPAAVRRRRGSGEVFAIARVVATDGSAPRPPGSTMIVGADGSVAGSLSGGCVEGAVYEIAREAMLSGRASLHRFGITDDEAFGVGLTCGGTIEVFVQPAGNDSSDVLEQFEAAVRLGRRTALATVVRHPAAAMIGQHLLIEPTEHRGSLTSGALEAVVVDGARRLLAAGETQVLHYGEDGRRPGDEVAVFVHSFVPAPRMIVFGAVEFGAALAQIGAYLGYRVTVCDAREIFATPSRFPAAAEVVVAWPHVYLDGELAAGRIDARTVVCVLTHDAKFDIPLLSRLLGLPDAERPGYLGAMGSRRTHERRMAALRAGGIPEGRLALLRSPIGLHLGGRTPAETAVSIVAEIIADRSGGTGRSLSAAAQAIHG